MRIESLNTESTGTSPAFISVKQLAAQPPADTMSACDNRSFCTSFWDTILTPFKWVGNAIAKVFTWLFDNICCCFKCGAQKKVDIYLKLRDQIDLMRNAIKDDNKDTTTRGKEFVQTRFALSEDVKLELKKLICIALAKKDKAQDVEGWMKAHPEAGNLLDMHFDELIKNRENADVYAAALLEYRNALTVKIDSGK